MKIRNEKLNTALRRMLSFIMSFVTAFKKKCKKPLVSALLVLIAVSMLSGSAGEVVAPLVAETVKKSSETAEFETLSLEAYPNGKSAEDKLSLSGWMPKGAKAQATDVTEEYNSDNAKNELLADIPWAKVIAAYDISILNGEEEYQPNSIYPIEVEISNPAIKQGSKLQLLHIKDDGTKEKISAFSVEDGKLSFSAKGFSVYAIVDLAAQASGDIEIISSLNDLAGDRSDDGFILYYEDTSNTAHYFTQTIVSNAVLSETTDASLACAWHFTPSGTGYKIYTVIGGVPKYIYNTTGVNVGLGTEAQADVIELSTGGRANSYYLQKSGEAKYLQHSGSGGGIRYYKDHNNANNSSIKIAFADSVMISDDFLKLDGKSIGLMSYSGGTVGYAFMADASNNSLNMVLMSVRTESSPKSLYVSEDSDITEWTFHNVAGQRYTISSEVGGVTKYLNIGNTLTLVNEAQASEITVLSNHQNQIMLSANDKSVNFNGTSFNGATSNSNTASQWLYFVEKSSMTSEDYITYYADKVSVSDVPNGENVIVYTRVWNTSTMSYDFYAIDHDGSLYPCYERGDNITWIGTQINTLLWNFTEYYDEDGVTPSNYYELYNPYSRKYIAPQIQDGQTLSDNTIGINLPGRGYGEYYSSIIAWDEPYYAYAGIQADIANGRILSGAKADADSFYFAVVETPSGSLTEVDTVDNSEYGITMKMIDFKAQNATNGYLQNDFLGTDTTSMDGATKNLLSTNLESNGYPTTTRTNHPLSDLYSGANEVNHLFLESTYHASGYYEYDSCQNFATLIDANGNRTSNFTVYKELGTTDLSVKPTLQHGQFFPYDKISANSFAVKNSENLYSALANPSSTTIGRLPESDPRKHERLHLVSNPNYYNGMEMTATFTSTPNGKDAWGNDIIFEFTGDDDFWFYADGELLIDLGGIHSALQGSVNFSTGQVIVEGVQKTIRQVFEENYRGRNPSATQQEVDDFLADFFEPGETVFRPYTTHQMRVFYMERGAGASNLHMRFNLSNVTPGNVMLTKTVTGSDDIDFNLVEYPYQIWYKDGNNVEHLLTNDNNYINVTYQNSTQRVDYLPVYTPPNSTASYDSVYLLNPGKSAEVHFPTNTIEYKIVECGINDEVYDSVKINGVTATGDTITGSGRSSYDSGWISVAQRPSIVFENHVDPDSLRTISIEKTLFDEQGNTLSASQDKSVFNYRLYLSNGTDDNLELANMTKYYVTDHQGHLCRWDASAGRLVPTTYSDYTVLTESEKASLTFETSMNGAISKIPAGYVVHIPNVTVGTKFMLVERENEIPVGYSFVAYERESGTYHAEDGDTLNSGWVRANESPKMYVQNKRGWGLDVNKQWSDSSFTKSHDPVYIAVYADGTLVPDTVREITSSRTTARYFFANLMSGKTFADYEVHEVELSNPVVDSDGKVTSYTAITRKLNDGDLTVVNAVASNTNTSAPYSYSVEYSKGEPVSTDDEQSNLKNVRTDTIMNTRTGGVVITLYDMKTNQPLAGGKFTLMQGDNRIGTFTSDSHGRVTIMYDFERNVNYTLTETEAPAAYVGIHNAAVFSIANDDTVTISGNSSEWQNGRKSDIAGDKLIAYIDIFNKPFTLSAIKVDSITGDPIVNAHFALYRSVSGIGGSVKDLNPIPGYEDLVTGTNGVIPLIDNTLKAGKYYITETSAAYGYELLTDDIEFTISPLGEITVDSTGHSNYLSITGTNENICTLTIPNAPVDMFANLTITKTVTGNMGNRAKDFTFTLTVADVLPTAEFEWAKNGVVQTVKLHSGDSFTLKHGESVTIVLPLDTDITIAENNDYYKTSFKLGDAAAEDITSKTFRLTGDATLAVTNTRDSTIPTGIFDTSVTPYAVTLVVIVVAFATVMIIKKKKRK